MDLAAPTSQPTGASHRLRPGERPIWWDATPDRDSFDLWRKEAAAAGVPVDAWVSLLLEFDFVLDDLPESLRPLELLAGTVSAGSEVHEVSFSPALRSWLEPGSLPPHFRDELPELAVPQRIAIRLRPGSVLAPRIRPELFALASECDREAARHARTLESWALSIAVKSSTSEPLPLLE